MPSDNKADNTVDEMMGGHSLDVSQDLQELDSKLLDESKAPEENIL